MRNFLQQTGVLFLALILTFSILYFFRNSKHFGMSDKGQQNTVFEVLDTSLDLLGQRIVDLVQNDNEKVDVAADFKEFRQRVYRQEVSPEELERVIAKVYSTGMDTKVMTPDEVKETLTVPDLPLMPDSMFLVRAKRFNSDSMVSGGVSTIPREFLTNEALLKRYSHIAQITVFEHAVREKTNSNEYPLTIDFDPKAGLRVRLDSAAYQHYLSGADEKLQGLAEKLTVEDLILIEDKFADYEGLVQQNVVVTHDGDSITVQMERKKEPCEYGHQPRILKADVRNDTANWKFPEKSVEKYAD